MSTPPQSPYRAPGAVVADPDQVRGAPGKAVVLGVLVDLGGTLVASVAIGFVYGVMLAMGGASAEEIERAAQIDPSSGLGILNSAVGFGFSFLGGYVCARIARQSELKWSAATGAISNIIAFVLALEGSAIALNLMLSIAGFGVVLLGGAVGARRNATGR